MDFQTVLGIPSGPQNLGGGGGHEFSKAVEKADVAAAKQVLCSFLTDIFSIVGLLGLLLCLENCDAKKVTIIKVASLNKCFIDRKFAEVGRYKKVVARSARNFGREGKV